MIKELRKDGIIPASAYLHRVLSHSLVSHDQVFARVVCPKKWVVCLYRVLRDGPYISFNDIQWWPGPFRHPFKRIACLPTKKVSSFMNLRASVILAT